MMSTIVSMPEASYSAAIVPMGNLPQPNPPANWILTKADTTVKQTSNAVLYNYDYTFSAPKGDKDENSIPAPSKITAPVVPASWVIEVEKLAIENKEKSLTYKYELSYVEKGAVGLLEQAKKKADEEKKKKEEEEKKKAEEAKKAAAPPAAAAK